jgi:hypothetical protein
MTAAVLLFTGLKRACMKYIDVPKALQLNIFESRASKCIFHLSHHSRRTNNGGHYLEEATINQLP